MEVTDANKAGEGYRKISAGMVAVKKKMENRDFRMCSSSESNVTQAAICR